MSTIYGYARVSTGSQSLKDQVYQLTHKGHVQRKNIYQEHYTGMKIHRPKFDELIHKLKPGDELVITKLDRFGRTASDSAKLMKKLLDEHISVNVLNMAELRDNKIGRFLINMLFAVSNLERDMIVERTQDGIRYAKAWDKKHGVNYQTGRKPRLYSKKRRHYKKVAEAFRYETASEVMDDFNIKSRHTIYNIWHAVNRYRISRGKPPFHRLKRTQSSSHSRH